MINEFQCDQMPVAVYESNEAMGAAAARDMASILRQAIASQGEVAVILATGNSQLTFLRALRTLPGIDWSKVSLFHMDEYAGMHEDHSASFRRYIKTEVVDHVRPKAFFGLAGDAPDIEAEMARYAALLEAHRPIACALGIGENGHLAFNDPPADFKAPRPIHLVQLAVTARQQQVNEGHFPTLDDVPQKAISLSIPTLLRPAHVLAIVPEQRKARAVKDALEGPVTPNCPASILRTLAHVKLYLDRESASLLTR